MKDTFAAVATLGGLAAATFLLTRGSQASTTARVGVPTMAAGYPAPGTILGPPISMPSDFSAQRPPASPVASGCGSCAQKAFHGFMA